MEERMKEFRRRISSTNQPNNQKLQIQENVSNHLAKFPESVPSRKFDKSALEEHRQEDMKIKAPEIVRQFLAETLGTFLLVLFGNGAIAQKVGFQEGPFMPIAFGYGFALMIGIMASGGVSGGHLNPAVTLAMASIRKCKWIQVPIYWAAQYLGAFLASATLYGVYADAINEVDKNGIPGSAGIWASYPNGGAYNSENEDLLSDPLPSTVTLFFDQLLGTALLLIIILSVTDERNMKVPSGLVPLFIGLGLTAIHLSFAFNAGCAINPARDFSPRLFTAMAGWKAGPFAAFDYFFWIPWLVPHFGGIVGAVIYELMVELHHPEPEETQEFYITK